MKRFITMLLCAAMLAATVAGCGRGVEESSNEPPAAEDLTHTDPDPNVQNDTNDPSDPADETYEQNDENEFVCFILDFLGAFNTFEPDTIMMTTAGGHTVTWEKMFFGFYGAIMNVLEALGEIADWYQVFGEGVTLTDIVFDMAERAVLRHMAIEHGAAIYGIHLSQEDLDVIQTRIEIAIEHHDGIDNLMRGLWYESGIRTLSMLEYILEIESLTASIFLALFEENGILSTDEGIDEFFATGDYGFLMAKHILISFEGDPESARERADEIWERLSEYTGDDIELFFDELMHLYSDDPGLLHFPQGYLFEPAEMVPEFSQGAYELEFGQFSRPIESVHGFHIIFRVPISNASISDIFSSMLTSWFDALQPVFTQEFYSIVLSEMFLPC